MSEELRLIDQFVFLLYEGQYSDRALLGVYDSLEIAQIAADGIWANRKHLVPHGHVWELNEGSLEEPRWQCGEWIEWRPESLTGSSMEGKTFRHGDDLDIEQRIVRQEPDFVG